MEGKTEGNEFVRLFRARLQPCLRPRGFPMLCLAVALSACSQPKQEERPSPATEVASAAEAAPTTEAAAALQAAPPADSPRSAAERREEELFRMQRGDMVERQLAGRDVRDPAVLDALRKVERHRFVPESQRSHAYEDRPLPIGEDQTISQPYIVGLMTQLLELEPEDKVLEIGTGSGYQAAILAEIVQDVYTIEIVESLGKRAKALLEDLGYENVHVRIGDGYRGWPEEAPFDKIVVTAAPETVPGPLIDQLAEGGKLVIPVGKPYNQRLQVLEKTKKGDLRVRDSIAVRFVLMTGEAMERDE